jgi:LDH2 family malate/lactate/ureidoglycolate dehydrogenase
MRKKKKKTARREVPARNAHRARKHNVGLHAVRKTSKRKRAPEYDIDMAKEGYVSGDQPSPTYYEY